MTLDFEALFRAAPAGSIITGLDGLILDVNEVFTTWTGLRREDVIGTEFLRLLSVADRILFATRSLPLLDLTGHVPETAATLLGQGRVVLPAVLVASRVETDPAVTVYLMGPRRERSFEEAQLLSAVHRAEASDTRRQEAEHDLRRSADHDTLTGLLNREGLGAALASTTSPDERARMYWIGLDHFRVINASLGRPAGDEILTTLARRLSRRYDGTDTLVARAGGDEFMIGIGITGAGGAGSGIAGSGAAGIAEDGDPDEDHAERLMELIAEPVTVEGLEIVVSASIGIASGRSVTVEDASDHPPPIEMLMRNSQAGMYEAKASGRGRWKHFTAATDDSVINEIRLLGEIRTGIAADQFRLEYQPQLDLRTGRPHGFEALMRWDHPMRGSIGPAGFIDLAERTGLINQLGTWACRTAFLQTMALADIPALALTRMSVNISARQLMDPRFPETVEELLRDTAADPARLTLELTETGLVADSAHAGRALQSIADLGVHLSIDDFGTGHAGFSYLNDFPVDEIKIDRSYVARLDTSPEAAAIVLSCIELAHALDITVVAEGVETESQLSRLEELGCDIVQGYHYARPVRAEALRPWVAMLGR
ncbi:putative bifunctional diguanylate cyclase/phosphodiesterase [Herbiconiux sp. P15]|uniref:putative bifunctional diguanylate cyclase/phosphodiesterase n=1 Tax=Herbiconiux liukaitaii TaxID=3342799 RepID=UPI0035BA9902